MEEISRISLTNRGGFVASINFVYLGQDGVIHNVEGTENFPVLQTRDASPGDYGVPDGSQVALKVGVVAGHDNQGRFFIYRADSGHTAHFTITGTTLDNRLEYEGVR